VCKHKRISYSLVTFVRLPQVLCDDLVLRQMANQRLVQVADPSQSRFPASLFTYSAKVHKSDSICLFLLLNVVQFHVRVHYAMEMELLWRMMDEFASSWEHHEARLLALPDCPQTNPAVYFLRFSIWTAAASLANP